MSQLKEIEPRNHILKLCGDRYCMLLGQKSWIGNEIQKKDTTGKRLEELVEYRKKLALLSEHEEFEKCPIKYQCEKCDTFKDYETRRK